MPCDGVVEADDEVVEGSGPAAGVVPGEGESGDNLAVVEVAHKVEGEFVDLVEGAEEAFRAGGTAEADIEFNIFRDATL